MLAGGIYYGLMGNTSAAKESFETVLKSHLDDEDAKAGLAALNN
jgi:hypothetical protein